MGEDDEVTAAWASIGDVSECSARVDAQVRAVLGRVLAQRRSVEVASGYLSALAAGVKANCRAIAGEAGHEGPHRMRALPGSYRWHWRDLRGELPALAAAWLACDPRDVIGPGAAIDETAQLKHGDAAACVAPQHAGITGRVENCVTAVFSAYVTTCGQAWTDFGVYLPDRRAKDPDRRRTAGIPGDLVMTTKPDLAVAQPGRLIAAGLPVGWAAFDEVYARSGKLRGTCETAGLAYVGIIPVRLPHHPGLRRRDPRGPGGQGCGVRAALVPNRDQGTPPGRLGDWALAGTASPRHFLLIRRLICRPDQLTFYLCHAPQGRPATMPYFIAIAGRRWPAEQTFRTGKDVLGWDQCQARTWDAVCRHTALSAPAQLRQAAIRNALCGLIDLPPATAAADPGTSHAGPDTDDADLRIPLGAPVPAYPGQPRPRQLGLIRLSVAETARLARLAAGWAAGLLTPARLAFRLRWSARRRRHQAAARWHHHAARLAAAT